MTQEIKQSEKEELLLWMRGQGYIPIKEMSLEEVKFAFNVALKDILAATKPNRNAMLVNIIEPE